MTYSSSFRIFLLLLASTVAVAQKKPSGDLGCAGVQLVVTASGCTGQPWYYSAQKPRINAKTKVPVKILQGRAGGASACDLLIPGSFVEDAMLETTACETISQSVASASDKIEAAVKKLLTANTNKQSLQRARLVDIKKAIFNGNMAATRKYSELDRLAVMDYLMRQKAAATNTAKQIDAAVQSAVKVNGGVASAITKLYTQLAVEQKVLQASVMNKVKKLQQQAKQNQANAANCAKGPGPKAARSLSAMINSRLSRRFLVPGHPTSLESLAARVPVRTPTTGPHAAPAPSCPRKNSQPKTQVPVSKTAEKTPPAKAPRAPATRPQTKPRSPAKQTVKRPASRGRRQPGKQAQPRRTTPRKKPRVVPKPTRRPKGTPRTRRRGRK